jgi:cell division protein FtsI/penicillin-binding protein 2
VPARILTHAEHPGRPQLPGSGTRLLLLVLAGAVWAGAVAGRLGYVAIARHQAYRAMAVRQQRRVISIAPERGSITDRNGHELAVSLPVQSCFAVPPEINNPGVAAHLLSPILGISERDLRKRLLTDRSFVWVDRQLSPEVVKRIKALHLNGIHFQREMERFYPKRQLAAQVLGFVDIDGHGQAGIEYSLDKQISGRPGQLFVLADARHHYYQESERPAVPGAKVELTIDENIQYIAEKALAEAIHKTHAIGGSVLVMNPSNGQVLAMANWPTFNPNLPGESRPKARQNRAISYIYEPGSTFKTVTISAAVNAGVVTPNEVFNCQMGHIVLAGRVIHDWHPFGMLTVGQVLMHSSDVGSIKIALRMGAGTFYHYMRAYGFGQKTGIDLPWESPGMLRPPRLWSGTAIGSMAMGQSVGVTPIQLIREISAIANGGLLYKPQIVLRIDKDGKVIVPPKPPPTRVISARTAAEMRHMMEGVVLGGTGHFAQLDGYTTAGKTGTAQKVDPVTHLYSHTRFMASFVGFAPINDPAVVTLVVLDSPHGIINGRWNAAPIYTEGGWVSAPVFKEVMQQVMSYLGVPRDLPVQPPLEHAKLRSRPRHRPLVRARSEAVSNAPAAAAVASPSVVPRGMVVMPSFVGETVRQATDQCLRLGLNPQLVGSGVAIGQRPGPGTLVRNGAHVRLRFALRPTLVPTKTGNGNAP